MCGIAGVMDLQGRRAIDRRLIDRMCHRLRHRGPDGSDAFLQPGIGLGHRRLAIIDVAGGSQPMFNETGDVVVVYNGEIYNYRELVRDLSARGHRFRTNSDTEVIVHAWEEWEAGCVERFRGMFAFALWDVRAETLFLARDRLGEKPLYYGCAPDGTLLFASEIGAIIAALPEVPELDAEAIEDYFGLGYVPDTRSIYRDVQKLPAAHTLTVRRGMAPSSPRRYWDVSFAARPHHDLAAACSELTDRLGTAVRMQMIADVPLGAFLSGGVDSSAIVAMMAAGSSMPVKSCSMGFDDPAADETAYAAMVAERYGTDHTKEIVQIDATSLIDRLANVYGEPFGDSSALPTYLLSSVARRRVTVALSGDGGDETFAGYRRYVFEHWMGQVRKLLPAGVLRVLAGPLAAVYPKLDWAPRVLRAKATFEALASDPVNAYLRAVTVAPASLRHKIMSRDFQAELRGYSAAEALRDHMGRCDSNDPVARAQYIDMHTWLPGAMLTKVDRASMAHSLEVRAPFLDHQLVEWAAGLPTSFKVSGSEGKHILKKALETRLPSVILHRPKHGFSVPLKAWFRGEAGRLVEAALGGSTLRDAGILDIAQSRRLLKEHVAGVADHSRLLWTLLMFDAFLRTHRADRMANAPSMIQAGGHRTRAEADLAQIPLQT